MGFFSRLFGRDREDTLGVPAMDGVFKPNTRLDEAERVLDLAGVDSLAAMPDRLYAGAGDALFRIDPDAEHTRPVKTFEGRVTMAAASPTGLLAVGVEGRGVELLDDGAWRRLDVPADLASCVTAGVFGDEDTLFLAIGSRQHPASNWKHDLMNRGSTGAILRCTLSTGAVDVVADHLAFPYGLAILGDGRLAVSESWRHRVVAIAAGRGKSAEPLIGDLPAYPARLAPSAKGGFWLALFAPRRQLTEFVLSEDDYRLEMMAQIPPQSWIGPDFDDGGEEQPLQAGSVRQMGIMKPWAPSRSYGLVARLDALARPVASFHSRANGRMHGIASVAEYRGQVYAASRGSGTLLRLGTDGAP